MELSLPKSESGPKDAWSIAEIDMDDIKQSKNYRR